MMHVYFTRTTETPHHTTPVWHYLLFQMVEKQMYRAEGPQWVNGILSSLTCQTRESTNLRLKVG